MWGSNILTGQLIFSCSVLPGTCADGVSNQDKDWIRNQEWTTSSSLIGTKQWRLAADWTVSTGQQPEIWGMWLFSFTRHALDHICNAVPSFGLCQDISELEWVQQKAVEMVGAWSTCPARRGWGNRACSPWRRDSLEQLSDTYREITEKMEPCSLQRCILGEQKTMTDWNGSCHPYRI